VTRHQWQMMILHFPCKQMSCSHASQEKCSHYKACHNNNTYSKSATVKKQSAQDQAWLQQKEEVLCLLYNDFELNEAGKAVYQVLELQVDSCRKYDAVKHSIQRGLEHGHNLKATTQRTIDLLGRQCQRTLKETAFPWPFRQCLFSKFTINPLNYSRSLSKG
jgi:hypothetical protein